MRSAFKILPHYTYDDYCHWEGKWEIIEGIPYAMSPMPRPEYQAVATNLASELRMAQKKAGCGCTVYQPIDYKVSEDTVLNPDVLVVCRPITGQYLDFPPDIVAEILSPSTALKDRHTKYDIYQSEGIPYYIIVDTEKRSVEVYRLKHSEYELQELNQSVPFSFSLSSCSFDLLFQDIWS
ncbi:Uma2 family endonuclease [Paraflavisolibacter sp. H34]|uniref:Uma2 family endonuclease n=1 Tax=Huijunlia imazamoxiresistens TaxID=3127457 RepID=UPI00301ADAE7